MKILVQKLSKEKIGGEKDEIAESSFIMQWFSGEGKNAAEDEDRQFILKLTPMTKSAMTKSVNIQLQNLEREPADSVLAEQVVKGLLIELN